MVFKLVRVGALVLLLILVPPLPLVPLLVLAHAPTVFRLLLHSLHSVYCFGSGSGSLYCSCCGAGSGSGVGSGSYSCSCFGSDFGSRSGSGVVCSAGSVCGVNLLLSLVVFLLLVLDFVLFRFRHFVFLVLALVPGLGLASFWSCT